MASPDILTVTVTLDVNYWRPLRRPWAIRRAYRFLRQRNPNEHWLLVLFGAWICAATRATGPGPHRATFVT